MSLFSSTRPSDRGGALVVDVARAMGWWAIAIAALTGVLLALVPVTRHWPVPAVAAGLFVACLATGVLWLLAPYLHVHRPRGGLPRLSLGVGADALTLALAVVVLPLALFLVLPSALLAAWRRDIPRE